ncbi:3-oxoacyl-[acyl-carrier-protein] synthase 2,3-oxoacyl-(acyl carrier protein) synthase II,Enoyl reductase domain of yeast-type FAS1,beta-ketoacyl-acyl-carrier-protein synthase II,Beta-ketoacyl synthase, N-terminal domain [Chlamydia serpentis]|uniref:3-oxoacyl-[acyl-carrier-protein] synthase 2 n=1 Tax=Chlamydia serpentis TaxID=1967782 RepID=A0A2R8FCI5_9CHLA|nr:beta-ketoacyl-ACP synthase II [Chlamydia serpentis]SPN74026.1 3-oxoacyl-[acyl-carrier-protein] synthase 2,3-oxoacyl-(acyl carrier protein) synthase II,Enoyl reductase domain of yeast-type FAS1,beta-ketoacyl-acyl-carrier-protein synthase II,Beta-ketoacyl synthase, N-terminal domain [Chlamydia serpentis]
MSKKRVVVTGVGVVSCLGNEVDTFYDNLLAGVSGVRTITAFPCEDYATRFAGWIPEFNPEPYLDKKQARRVDPFITYAMVAAKKAIAMSRWDKDHLPADPVRCGAIIGSGMGGLSTLDQGMERLLVTHKKLSPFFIPYIITNMAPALIAMDFGLMGPNYSISTACATANYCIDAAYQHLVSGRADMIICGGTEAAVNRIGLEGFIANRALSERNDAPAQASRPWDRDRDGFVLGEGAGILILETLENALRRHAPIFAEVLGSYLTCDAFHITAPRDDGEGITACVLGALDSAGIPKERVNYVNAHGTSTPLGDISEVLALKKAFGSHIKNLRMNSTKSLIGHCLGAAGGIEAVVTIQAILTGKLHPTINLDNPITEIEDFDVVANKAQDWDIDVAMSNSFGFGGHNSTILFSRYVP